MAEGPHRRYRRCVGKPCPVRGAWQHCLCTDLVTLAQLIADTPDRFVGQRPNTRNDVLTDELGHDGLFEVIPWTVGTRRLATVKEPCRQGIRLM